MPGLPSGGRGGGRTPVMPLASSWQNGPTKDVNPLIAALPLLNTDDHAPAVIRVGGSTGQPPRSAGLSRNRPSGSRCFRLCHLCKVGLKTSLIAMNPSWTCRGPRDRSAQQFLIGHGAIPRHCRTDEALPSDDVRRDAATSPVSAQTVAMTRNAPMTPTVSANAPANGAPIRPLPRIPML